MFVCTFSHSTLQVEKADMSLRTCAALLASTLLAFQLPLHTLQQFGMEVNLAHLAAVDQELEAMVTEVNEAVEDFEAGQASVASLHEPRHLGFMARRTQTLALKWSCSKRLTLRESTLTRYV